MGTNVGFEQGSHMIRTLFQDDQSERIMQSESEEVGGEDRSDLCVPAVMAEEEATE